MGQRSLKVIESGTIWKFGYGFLIFPTLTLTLGLVLGLAIKGYFITLKGYFNNKGLLYWVDLLAIAKFLFNVHCTICHLSN